MRLWKILGRLKPCLLATGVCLLLSPNQLTAQDLIPAVRLSVDAGDWSAGGSWTLSGSDPAEEGVPGEEEIASIRNGGTATVSSAVSNVSSLAITDGTVDFGAGGSLAVAGQTIVGDGGTASFSGGSLTTDSLAVFGTVNLSADVATDLSFGSSYPIATSSSLVSSPSKITVGGSVPGLAAGLALGLVGTDAGASVVVESLPILQVDRATGVATINNLAGGPFSFKGYTVSSKGEKINRTGGDWNSLADQSVEGWEEANPTRTTRFSELNLLGSSTLDVGASLNIGPLYKGIGDSPSQEDLGFEVLLADGRIVTTDVMYLGSANDLVLSIDPDTGAGSLSNASSLIDPFDVTGISVLSASGSLTSANFTGIGEEGWENANPQDTAVTEVNLTGSKVFGTGSSADIGNLFTVGGEQDLVFQFSTADNALRTGTVVYGIVPDPPACDPNTMGDIDGNGVVEFADFLTLSANFGDAATDHTTGDVNCNGVVDFPDFLTLSANFGSTVPAASASSVPEPTSGLLIFLGVLGMLKFRRRAPHIAAVMVAASLCCVTTQQAMAQDKLFNTQFIRIHPDGPNGAINSTAEARGILNGTVQDVIINEELTGTINTVDLAGGDGSFANDQSPYLNGVDNDTMDDFLQYISGTVTIPEGDWTVAVGSDDGGFVNLTGVALDATTYNENGANGSR